MRENLDVVPMLNSCFNDSPFCNWQFQYLQKKVEWIFFRTGWPGMRYTRVYTLLKLSNSSPTFNLNFLHAMRKRLSWHLSIWPALSVKLIIDWCARLSIFSWFYNVLLLKTIGKLLAIFDDEGTAVVFLWFFFTRR